jgi:hypothetical protein
MLAQRKYWSCSKSCNPLRRANGAEERNGDVVDRGRVVARCRKPPRAREAPLDWPDEEFLGTWNIQTHERRELEAAQEADQMKWVRQFLDEDSDAASSEGGVRDEDAFWRVSDRVGSSPPQQGHGKMIPLSSREGTGSIVRWVLNISANEVSSNQGPLGAELGVGGGRERQEATVPTRMRGAEIQAVLPG